MGNQHQSAEDAKTSIESQLRNAQNELATLKNRYNDLEGDKVMADRKYKETQIALEDLRSEADSIQRNVAKLERNLRNNSVAPKKSLPMKQRPNQLNNNELHLLTLNSDPYVLNFLTHKIKLDWLKTTNEKWTPNFKLFKETIELSNNKSTKQKKTWKENEREPRKDKERWLPCSTKLLGHLL